MQPHDYSQAYALSATVVHTSSSTTNNS